LTKSHKNGIKFTEKGGEKNERRARLEGPRLVGSYCYISGFFSTNSLLAPSRDPSVPPAPGQLRPGRGGKPA